MIPDLADPAIYRDGLPPEAFTTAAFAKVEDARLWPRTWVCIGAAAEIPAPGDLLPYTVGVHGIHVQRLSDGGLVGRFNKAQHGGCHFIPLQCQSGRKTRCGFTSCGYSLDRDPIPAAPDGGETPEMYQYLGMRPDRLGAVTVHAEGPLLFVSVEPSDAPPATGALPPVVRPLDRTTVNANWKLVATSLGDRPQADLPAGNLVLLRDEDECCAVILQPIAPARTACRIVLLSERSLDEKATARWRGELDERFAGAVAWQATGRPSGEPSSAVAGWQARLIGALLKSGPERRPVRNSAYPRNHRYGFVA